MSTVINLRGTGGAGKSTVVRRVMALYPERRPVTVAGRRQPHRYMCVGPSGLLYVPGHYETACGGCDTIKTVDEVYAMVNEAAAANCDVLFEGIMVQDDVHRALELDATLRATSPPGQLTVIGLTTTIEDCLAAIRQRRVDRGDERPLDERNTRQRRDRQVGIWRRLEAGGVPVARLDREGAFAHCCGLLRLTPGAG